MADLNLKGLNFSDTPCIGSGIQANYNKKSQFLKVFFFETPCVDKVNKAVASHSIKPLEVKNSHYKS